MTTQVALSALSLLATVLVAVIGGLLRRALRQQDQANADRAHTQERAEAERHAVLQQALSDQRKSLEDEIRATRSDVRLVVGEVGVHGKQIAATAAMLEGAITRIAAVEKDVKQIVRDGCAHALTCKG